MTDIVAMHEGMTRHAFYAWMTDPDSRWVLRIWSGNDQQLYHSTANYGLLKLYICDAIRQGNARFDLAFASADLIEDDCLTVYSDDVMEPSWLLDFVGGPALLWATANVGHDEMIEYYDGHNATAMEFHAMSLLEIPEDSDEFLRHVEALRAMWKRYTGWIGGSASSTCYEERVSVSFTNGTPCSTLMWDRVRSILLRHGAVMEFSMNGMAGRSLFERVSLEWDGDPFVELLRGL